MAVSARQLLFVNESACSPSPAKRKEINAHVQKARHERTRQQKINALRSQRAGTILGPSLHGGSNSPTSHVWYSTISTLPVAQGSHRSISNSAAVGKVTSQNGRKHESSELEVRSIHSKSKLMSEDCFPARTLKRVPTSQTSTGSERKDGKDQDLLNQANLAERRDSIMRLKPQGSAGDPFNTTTIKLDAWTVSMLEYYMHLMSVGVFKAETAFLAPRQQFRHRSILQKAVTHSLTHETYFFALMAGSTGRLRLNTKHQNLRAAPEAFAGRALKALRIHLRQEEHSLKIDPLIVLGIHAMMLFALYVMDFSAAGTHLSMMIDTVDKLYGFQGLDNIFQEICVEADVGLSRATFKRPITPGTWYPENLPEVRMKEIQASLPPQAERAGESFLRYSTLLGDELSSIAVAMASVVQVASIAWENGGTSSTESQWLSQSSHALMHRLLCLTPSDDDEPDFNALESHQTRQREAIRTSLVIWLSFITTYLAPSPLGRRHPLRLQQALLRSKLMDSESLRASWQGYEPLLMWILSVGHSVAKVTKSETLDFFSMGVIDIAEVHQIQTIGQLRKTIESFLYSERAQGPSLWALSDNLRARNVPN